MELMFEVRSLQWADEPHVSRQCSSIHSWAAARPALHAAKLTAFLLKEYDLTIDDVKQHYDFNGKDCPLIIRQEGRWDEFLGMVQQNL